MNSENSTNATIAAIAKITTERLHMRPLELRDAPVMLELFNQPDCIKYIGDKNLASIEDAEQYLINGPLNSYRVYGIGLLAVCVDDEVIGVCGLLQREHLPHPDLGYGFLSRSYGKGYASEAAAGVLAHYQERNKILALTHPENAASKKVLLNNLFTFVEQRLEHEQPTDVFEFVRASR